MTDRTYRVRCFECDPPKEYDAMAIFAHWQVVHDLRFDLFEVTPEGERAVEFDTEPRPISALALEVQLDRVEASVQYEWAILRPYYRWKIRRLRREVDRLRDDQIARLLQTPFK